MLHRHWIANFLLYLVVLEVAIWVATGPGAQVTTLRVLHVCCTCATRCLRMGWTRAGCELKKLQTSTVHEHPRYRELDSRHVSGHVGVGPRDLWAGLFALGGRSAKSLRRC